MTCEGNKGEYSMNGEKTTKEILKEETVSGEHIPLYNPEALKKIREEFDKWKNTMVREQDRENWEVTPHTILGSELPRELLYTPHSNPEFDYLRDLGFSGGEPYTRGIHPNMYRGRTFTMRQIFGAGSPERVNQRIKFLLEHGATGTNWALDLATV